jgi:hypothetical protein
MEDYVKRYKGIRWTVFYGSYTGVSRHALHRLYGAVQYFLPYVIACDPATGSLNKVPGHAIIMGTPDDNLLVRSLEEKGIIFVPEAGQGYTIARIESPLHAGNHIIVIAGRDENGVLHAVYDFCRQLSDRHICSENPDPVQLSDAFDTIPLFDIREQPCIHRRGIWTWGYVIHDYRRFIDNMAQLRMNMLVMWNDCLPLNINEIIAYAHARGIGIIPGFHWGWGLEGLDISSTGDRARIKDMVLENYFENYRDRAIDGIYFQTLTEHRETELHGQPFAAVVCSLVNEIGQEILKEKPDLRIEFGLHATSIREHYTDLAQLDPRITIVWEDVEGFPYTYEPVWHEQETLEKTIEYTRKLIALRPGLEFAMVAKGWTTLDWSNEFEHHGSFILGEETREAITERLKTRQQRWDAVNKLWYENAGHAARFYRELLKCKPSCVSVYGLIEDGLFEETIQPSVALFAETLWTPQTDG